MTAGPPRSGPPALGPSGRQRDVGDEMKTMPETTGLDADLDADVMTTTSGDRTPRRSLIFATVLTVVPAVIATTVAMVLRRRRAAAAPPRSAPTRSAPTSTINVNWGFALFGSNVMGERRRGLRGRLSHRR